MSIVSDSHEREVLGGFLEELALNVERPEDAETLLGILKNLRDDREDVQSAGPVQSATGDSRRYDIFKLCPNRIERIGFVRARTMQRECYRISTPSAMLSTSSTISTEPKGG